MSDVWFTALTPRRKLIFNATFEKFERHFKGKLTFTGADTFYQFYFLKKRYNALIACKRSQEDVLMTEHKIFRSRCATFRIFYRGNKETLKR